MAQGTIEVDPTVLKDEDKDDYLSTGYNTSTVSLSESLNQYIYENGRRYHSYFGCDKNPHPTDEMEQDRLDLHHEMVYLLYGRKLHFAPIENPHRILDVGTGTGIWAIDMADQYPMAEVIGVDLSPIQPAWVPPNCKFEVDDVELEWTYQPDFFDFIHVRNLGQAITSYPRLLQQIYRCVKPGGFVEISEVEMELFSDNGTLFKAKDLTEYMVHLRRAMEKLGRPWPCIGMRENILNAGFVDMVETNVKQPLGPWAKDPDIKKAGEMALLGGETGYHAYAMQMFTRVLGMSAEEANTMCTNAFKTVCNKDVHIYANQFVAYAKKPE
ncbi:S-adenosyl-L-methionine-dependent methyltransferase [Pyronema omphalodes]|nr:S-adenosyl-L-methionine-dependent methyltransferase [Pyronema omphalodes]